MFQDMDRTGLGGVKRKKLFRNFGLFSVILQGLTCCTSGPRSLPQGCPGFQQPVQSLSLAKPPSNPRESFVQMPVLLGAWAPARCAPLPEE